MNVITKILQSIDKIDDVLKVVKAFMNAFERFTETLKDLNNGNNETK